MKKTIEVDAAEPFVFEDTRSFTYGIFSQGNRWFLDLDFSDNFLRAASPVKWVVQCKQGLWKLRAAD